VTGSPAGHGRAGGELQRACPVSGGVGWAPADPHVLSQDVIPVLLQPPGRQTWDERRRAEVNGRLTPPLTGFSPSCPRDSPALVSLSPHSRRAAAPPIQQHPLVSWDLLIKQFIASLKKVVDCI